MLHDNPNYKRSLLSLEVDDKDSTGWTHQPPIHLHNSFAFKFCAADYCDNFAR